MYEQVEKPKENKSRAVAHSVVQKKGAGKQSFGFVDKRPESAVQKKLKARSNLGTQYIKETQKPIMQGMFHDRSILNLSTLQEKLKEAGYAPESVTNKVFVELKIEDHVYSDMHEIAKKIGLSKTAPTLLSAEKPRASTSELGERSETPVMELPREEEHKKTSPEMAKDSEKSSPMLMDKKLTPMGRGSSHKIAFEIEGDSTNCFVSIPQANAGSLQHELKLYTMLASVGVRIPLMSKELVSIEFEGQTRVGIVMEKLIGTEYKQTLTWMFVKKQIESWPQQEKKAKVSSLKNTISSFVNSKALVTDLQVFILNTSGEMVVFDPSTVSLNETVNYTELEGILDQLEKLLQTLQ